MLSEWIFRPNFLNGSELNQLRSAVNSAVIRPNLIDRGSPKKQVDVSVLHYQDINYDLSPIVDAVYRANEEVFGFELYGPPHLFNVNKYHKDTNQYPYHKDFSGYGTMYDVKLTMILNISESADYQGGEFEFFTGEDSVIPEMSQPGTLLVFPSIWYHRVKPVLSGQRTTISAWFKGPLWR